MKKIKKNNPSRKMINEFIDENYSDEAGKILLADGFDEAFLGIGCSCGGKNVAVYDRAKCIKILERDMSYEEAEEYFSFNTEGAYVGEYTPIFMHRVNS